MSEYNEKRIGDFIVRDDYGLNAYYVGSGGDVIIPEEISDEISLHFEDAKGITSLKFPKTMTSISDYTVGSNCFGSRSTLERLEFPEGMKAIWGTGCFANCPKLSQVILPESLEELGLSAFKGSPWLKENLISEGGCQYLGPFLISSDEEIVHADIREGTKQICSWAFRGRKLLRSVRIPESVKLIGEQAFTSCEMLEEVIISGEGLQVIQHSAFTGCTHLKRIEIPNSCKKISEIAFVSNTGKILYLPDYAYIPNRAGWAGIQNLFDCACYLTSKERHSPESQEIYTAACKKIKSKLLDFVIEQGHITALKNLAPIAITKANIIGLIEQAQTKNNIALTAFLLEWKDKNVSTAAEKNQESCELNKFCVSATELKKIWSTKKLANGTLCITSYKGEALEVEVPAFIGKTQITEIGREAFIASKYSRRLTAEEVAVREQIRSVIIPDGVTTIGFAAFNFCSSLERLVVPASVSEINKFAFSGNEKLTICAPAGSYAETYAKENNIPFVAE